MEMETLKYVEHAKHFEIDQDNSFIYLYIF